MKREVMRRALALYAGAPLGDRLHVMLRWVLCPFERLAEFVPEEGLIVDLGCGHGLFANALALERSGRRVVGVEPSARKLAVARASAGPARFVRGEAQHNPIVAPCRAVLLIDVLYLLPPAQQEQVLRDVYHRLVPGGVLLIKTMDDRPRWKAALDRLEEWLAVRVLRITLGSAAPFAFRSLREWEALCREIGFQAWSLRLDRGYYHPHGVVVGVRP